MPILVHQVRISTKYMYVSLVILWPKNLEIQNVMTTDPKKKNPECHEKAKAVEG
jgi:hypothetical protein